MIKEKMKESYLKKDLKLRMESLKRDLDRTKLLINKTHKVKLVISVIF